MCFRMWQVLTQIVLTGWLLQNRPIQKESFYKCLQQTQQLLSGFLFPLKLIITVKKTSFIQLGGFTQHEKRHCLQIKRHNIKPNKNSNQKNKRCCPRCEHCLGDFRVASSTAVSNCIPNTYTYILFVLAKSSQVMPGSGAYTFNPSTRQVEAGGSLCVRGHAGLQSDFWAARATQRNPISKKKNTSS